MKVVHWAYIAGFLDGDGWITGSKNKNCLTMSWVIGFTQVDRKHIFMKNLQTFFINNRIKANLTTRKTYGSIKKETKMINVTIKEQKSIVILLNKIITFLIMKKDLTIK